MAYVTMTKRSAGYVVPASEWNQLIDNDEYLHGLTQGGRSWNPFAPPTSAASQDDEFNDSSLDAKWTEFDPNSKLTLTEGDGGLSFSDITTAATDNVAGVYQALPSGNCTLDIAVALSVNASNIVRSGITLWEDPTNNTKKLFLFGGAWSNGTYIIAGDIMTNNTTWSSRPWSTTPTGLGWSLLFFRLRRTTTTWSFDYSAFPGARMATGGTQTEVQLGFTPTNMGIAISNFNTGITHNMQAFFFRYRSSDVGANAPVLGRWVLGN